MNEQMKEQMDELTVLTFILGPGKGNPELEGSPSAGNLEAHLRPYGLLKAAQPLHEELPCCIAGTVS